MEHEKMIEMFKARLRRQLGLLPKHGDELNEKGEALIRRAIYDSVWSLHALNAQEDARIILAHA